MANRLMMCLTCGKNFATVEEANTHHEYFKQRELETRIYLAATKVSWNTNYTQTEVQDPASRYVPAHVVQISDPVGIVK